MDSDTTETCNVLEIFFGPDHDSLFVRDRHLEKLLNFWLKSDSVTQVIEVLFRIPKNPGNVVSDCSPRIIQVVLERIVESGELSENDLLSLGLVVNSKWELTYSTISSINKGKAEKIE